jgi:pantetheine-phosphate adenylyltransferase
LRARPLSLSLSDMNINTKRIAVFPGSFDPITTGHVEIVRRAIPLFDEVVVAIGQNSQKKYLFSLDQRLQWLNNVFSEEPTVRVDYFEHLTAHYCQSIDARFLIRGLRNAADFDYEKTISQLNDIVGQGLDTIFLISRPNYSHISSTIVREIILGGGDASPFLPPEIALDDIHRFP